MKGNTKYVVEFTATKKLRVSAKDEVDALTKAKKRVGKFWQPLSAKSINDYPARAVSTNG